MELIQLTPQAYQLKGGSNAGLVVAGDQAVLIDTGLDRDTAKKILRHVEALKVRLAAVVITHAHADHFGGAATVRTRTGAPVYAPDLEAAIVANPILEPLYLFSGALPPAELRHKFTLAEGCPVDHLIGPGPLTIGDIRLQAIAAPGHAPNQIMIGGGGVCFVADALFAPDILDKHGIPFYVHIDQALDTLERLPDLNAQYAAFVPGHGPAVADISEWAALNYARLAALREAVAAAVAATGSLPGILQETANALHVTITNPVTYWLAQTTVLACLASLQASSRVRTAVIDNAITWEPI